MTYNGFPGEEEGAWRAKVEDRLATTAHPLPVFPFEGQGDQHPSDYHPDRLRKEPYRPLYPLPLRRRAPLCVEGLPRRAYNRSNTAAMPCPPPIHIVTKP